MLKVTKEILQISNPSFRNIPPTAVIDTARIGRVSKSSRFSRSRTPTPKPKPKPKPKPVAKPVKRTTRFTPKPAPKPAPKPVVTPPKPTTSRTVTRGSVRFTRTPTPAPKPKPKPVVRTVRTPPKPTPKPVVRTTRFTPKPVTKKVTAPKPKVLSQAKTKAKVPFISGVPALLGGAKTVSVPLALGSTSITGQPQPKSTDPRKLEGFKGTGEGFLGGRGAVEGRAEALDLTDKVLSETPSEVTETIVSGGPPVETITPGGPAVFDPVTGITTTPGDIVTTDTPGDITTITTKGGVKTIGKSKIKSDFSDPLGSLGAGISQSALNEVIGIKNIAAIAQGKEQEEFFATPSSVIIGGAIDSVSRLGGQIFDFGRSVAGKKKVEPGQSITTFGGLSSTGFGEKITINQQERGPDAFSILESSGQRFGRLVEADPLFAIGDAAVQIPLLVLAPVKAASVAIKGIGATAKFAKVASKGVGAIKGRGLQSASGKLVTAPRPKTPLSTTFADEFRIAGVTEKAQAPAKAQLKGFGGLSTRDKSKLVKAQRDEFEVAIDTAQKQPKVKGLRFGEETADFVQRRRDAIEVARLPKGRISPTQLSPDLQKSIKQLESGGDPDLFKVKNVGFTSTKISLGKGAVKKVGSDESGNVLLGGSKPKPGGPDTGFFGVGPKGGAKTTSVGGFKSTVFDLGGIGKAVDKPIGGAGFSGTSINLGLGVAKKTVKVSKAQVDKLAKSAKISKDRARTVLRETGEAGLDTKEAKVVRSSEGLALITRTVTKQSKALKELNEAKVALKKTKSTQKTVSSVADQKTQRRLSNLIKVEKTKAKTAGKSISAEKATQAALRTLIKAEKTKIGSRAIAKSDDILFAKPRKLKGKGTGAIFETVRTPRGKQAGILGGLLTGTAIGAGVGLGNLGLQDPKIVQKDPTKLIFDPGSKQTQFQKQPKISTTIFQQPPRTTQIQQPRLATTFFQQPKQTTKTQQTSTQKTQQPFQNQIQQPFITTTIPPGTPRFPPGGGGFFEGSRRDEAKETKSQRRFFRLFDVAKTPFGKIEVGLGAQVQSDKPIFEFEDVPLRSGKKRKNLGDDFLSQDFGNIFA